MVQQMPLHPKTPSSHASFKCRLVFWYWLTQVVLEKRPLNGCSSSSYLVKVPVGTVELLSSTGPTVSCVMAVDCHSH